jgi:hypothetical protein
MGVKMSPPVYRCFNMRNPVAKAVVLSLVVLVLLGLMLRSDTMDVKNAIVKSASAAKAAMTQEPLDRQDPEPVDEAAEDDVETNKAKPPQDPPLALTNTSMAMTCDRDMQHLLVLQDKYGLGTKFEVCLFATRHTRPCP